MIMAKKKDGHHFGNRKPRKGGRRPGDNPHIRHSKGENRSIDLREDYEVSHAKKVGAINVRSDGGVSPVRGRTHVSHGRLVYDRR